MTHRRKLERAKVHLEALNQSITDFLKLDPYRLVGEYQVDSSEWVVRGVVAHPQPPDWSEIVGDCIHNLRASLDHLVWSLSTPSGAAPTYPKQVGFPICDTLNDFKGRREVALADVPEDAKPIFERFQPYNGRNGLEANALRILKKLDDVDKHQRLHFVGCVASEIQITFRSGTPFVAGRVLSNFGAFDDGAEVARVQVVSLTSQPKAKMQADHSAFFDIAFAKEGPAEGRPVANVLAVLFEQVERAILPKLEPFLEPGVSHASGTP